MSHIHGLPISQVLFVKFTGCQQRMESLPAKNVNTLEQNHIKMVKSFRLAYGILDGREKNGKNDSFSQKFGHIIFRLIKWVISIRIP